MINELDRVTAVERPAGIDPRLVDYLRLREAIMRSVQLLSMGHSEPAQKTLINILRETKDE